MDLKIKGLNFSHSKQYRDGSSFLQKHGFIDVLSIDANVKSSRSSNDQNSEFQINGADIDTYNNSHIMNDSFIIWKIVLPESIVKTEDDINIKIQKLPKFIYIWNYIKSFPIFSFIFFIILLIIFNLFLGKIGQILFKILIRVDIIGMFLSILYFGQRFIKYMLSLITVNYVMYDDIKVSFINKNDLNIISGYLISGLKSIFSELDASDILIYNNNIYIKQPNQIYPQDLISLADNLLTKKYKSETQKIDLINSTFSAIRSSNISNLFTKK